MAASTPIATTATQLPDYPEMFIAHGLGYLRAGVHALHGDNVIEKGFTE